MAAKDRRERRNKTPQTIAAIEGNADMKMTWSKYDQPISVTTADLKEASE